MSSYDNWKIVQSEKGLTEMVGYIFLVKIDNIGFLKLKFPLASSLLQ